jgi:hypothetical protein
MDSGRDSTCCICSGLLQQLSHVLPLVNMVLSKKYKASNWIVGCEESCC